MSEQHYFNKWEHYVPLHFDLSDVEHQNEWAKTHDAEAKKIAEAARERALKLFSPHHMSCYVHVALRTYRDMMAYRIDTLPEGAKPLHHLCKKGKSCGHLHASFNN